MRAPISAADLFRAFAALGPSRTEQQERATARMLGFDWREERSMPATKPASPVSAPSKPEPKPSPRPQPPSPRPSDHQPAEQAIAGFRLSAPKPAAAPKLEWLSSVPAMADRPMGQPDRPAPLFQPMWTRAILGAGLSSRSLSGPPDIDRMVETIARGLAITEIPRQPVMTLARGVQALIDVGEGMQPFEQDSSMLLRDLQRLIGDGSLDIVQFAGSPQRSRRDPYAMDWQNYEANFLPQLGACVLIVSDFGIGRPLGSSDRASLPTWRALAARLKRHGHRVVGFVPYVPSRWPRSLRRLIELVLWDRSTTVGRVRFSRHWSLSP